MSAFRLAEIKDVESLTRSLRRATQQHLQLFRGTIFVEPFAADGMAPDDMS